MLLYHARNVPNKLKICLTKNLEMAFSFRVSYNDQFNQFKLDLSLLCKLSRTTLFAVNKILFALYYLLQVFIHNFFPFPRQKEKRPYRGTD